MSLVSKSDKILPVLKSIIFEPLFYFTESYLRWISRGNLRSFPNIRLTIAKLGMAGQQTTSVGSWQQVNRTLTILAVNHLLRKGRLLVPVHQKKAFMAQVTAQRACQVLTRWQRSPSWNKDWRMLIGKTRQNQAVPLSLLIRSQWIRDVPWFFSCFRIMATSLLMQWRLSVSSGMQISSRRRERCNSRYEKCDKRSCTRVVEEIASKLYLKY